LFAVIIIYLIAAVIIIIIGGIKNRKKREPSSLVKKLFIALNLFGAAVMANYVAALTRMGQYALYKELLPHFIINIAYMIFAPLCSFFILKHLKRTGLSKVNTLLCLLSCVISIVLVVLMIIWEFYR